MKAKWFSTLVIVMMLAAVIAPAAGAAPAAATSKNPLGVLIVKFKGGLTSQQMKDAVTSAGGEVITDLSKINAIAAVASKSSFKTDMAKNPNVKKVFEDKMSIRISPVDAGTEASGKNNPQLGNPGPNGPPDPWHNLSSFLGETNPEGILQWD